MPSFEPARRREPPLSTWHRSGAEPDRIRRVGTGSYDVWPAVAIEIRERKPIHGALAVIPTNFLVTVRACVVIHRPRHLHISHHNIQPPVAIEIGNCQRVRWPRRARKPLRLTELPSPTVVDHVSRLFCLVDVRQIQAPVSIKVAGGPHADPGKRWPNLRACREMALP